MRQSKWSPSLVPSDDQSVYLVIDDLGRHGRVWRETDMESTDLVTVITDLVECQYSNPVRVIAFNTAEGWSSDVSGDVAHMLRRWSDLQLTELPTCLDEFVRRHEPRDRQQLTLRLV